MAEYIFTKVIAEDLLRNKSGDLPIGIFRSGIGNDSQLKKLIDFFTK